jgi:hypothetical protein
MDYFSLGMACLWLMFEKYLSGIESLPQEVQWVHLYITTCIAEPRSYSVLEAIKKEDKLLQFAIQITLGAPGLEEDQKQELLQIFSGSLPCHPNLRWANLREQFGALPSEKYILAFHIQVYLAKLSKIEYPSFVGR